MNGIKYPAAEIEGDQAKGTGYRTLNRSPAPLGHPTIEGAFVSAREPEGINIGWVGAWNENVRRENGRVWLDKVVDVTVASQSPGGQALLEALNKGEAIHTSTGLFGRLDNSEGDGHDYVIRDLVFDHDAFLLGEQGAATPDQGVGVFVNTEHESEQIDVINSTLEDDAERELDWAADYAARAVEKIERVSLIERVKAAIKEALMPERKTEAANQGAENMADEKQLEALANGLSALADAVKGIPEAVKTAVNEAVKPIQDNLAEVKANAEAKDKAELADLRNKIVAANVMDDTAAGELTLNTARAVAKTIPEGTATALNKGTTKGADDFEGYSMNAKAGA